MMIMPFLGKAAAVVGGTVLACGALAYSGGVVDVCVKEKTQQGHHIHLPLPALAGSVALQVMPERHFRHAPRELQQWLPAIRIAAQELRNIPDGPLVEVQNARETVRIVKDGGNLVIDVDNQRETVHVSLPLSMVASMAATLSEQVEFARPGV